jgi:hypothetical protein
MSAALLTAAAHVQAADNHNLQRYDCEDAIVYAQDMSADELRVIDWRLHHLVNDYHQWFADFPRKLTHRINVYLYSRDDPARPNGARSHGRSISLARDRSGDGMLGNRYLWGGVQHEMTHQFLSACGEGRVPPWASEGLSSYHGRMLFSGLSFYRGMVTPRDVRWIRSLLTNDTPESFDDFFYAGRWTGNRNSYARGWSMVQFLLHTDGPFEGRLRRIMIHINQRRTWDELFKIQFPDREALREAYIAYWQTMPEDGSAYLQARARVETLTAILGSAWAADQKFDNFDAFIQAARHDQLKTKPRYWLPPYLQTDALKFVDQTGMWAIHQPADRDLPTLTVVLDDGTHVNGSFNIDASGAMSIRMDHDELLRADHVGQPGEDAATFARLKVTGSGFELQPFDAGTKSQSNRRYVWSDVPRILAGRTFTQLAGGDPAQIDIRILEPGTAYVATIASIEALVAVGWQITDMRFNYTDRHRSELTVLTKTFDAPGVTETIPQDGWAGTIVILPETSAK